MNKTKALIDFADAFNDPKKTWSSFEETTKFLGAMNMLMYGVNPYKPSVQNPDDASDNDETTIEKGE